MPTLSSPKHMLKSHYPVMIIGSGYGGSIMASRLSRAGQQVCLLERGREFQVGEYPNNELQMLENIQVSGLTGCGGSRNGLYHVYFDKDISAFVGCGLGGTSLVNANVSLRAEQRVFDDPCWPQAFRDDYSTRMEDGYRHAEEMLKPTPYPNDFPPLAKMQALETSAAALGEKFYRPPINVSFLDGINHVGVQQHACKLCGDCVSGCNYAAKNTLIMNYLPDAKNHGAEIFTQMAVPYLEHIDGRWVVYYQDLSSEDDNSPERTRFITADLVILAAGTFGSTEILLRSKEKGLKLSNKVGYRFSGNGDVLAFGYNTKEPINGVGFGSHSPGGRTPVGPCITGIIDMRNRTHLDDGFVIEEGSIPGGIASFLPKIFALSAQFLGTNTVNAGAFSPAFHNPITHTQTYLVMSHDDGEGRLLLENDQFQIRWPNVGGNPSFTKINATLKAATAPLEGTFIPNPVWSVIQ